MHALLSVDYGRLRRAMVRLSSTKLVPRSPSSYNISYEAKIRSYGCSDYW